MGRRRKNAKLFESPTHKFDINQVLGHFKVSSENHKAFAVLDPRPPKKMKATNEQWRYGSVAADVSNYTARSEELCKRVEKILSKACNNPQAVHDMSSITPPGLIEISDVAITKSDEEKASCRRNLFLRGFGSSNINDFVPSSLSSFQKSGSTFPVVESVSGDTFIQERLDICVDSSIEKNDVKKLYNGGEQEIIVIDLTDDEPEPSIQIIQSEEKFQLGKEKDLNKDTGSNLDNQGDCQTKIQCHKHIMEDGLKHKQDGEPSKRINGIWEDGEVGQRTTGTLGKVREDMDMNLNVNHNTQLSQKHVEMGTKVDGKAELSILVETTKGLQDSSKDILNCVTQNTDKLMEDKYKDGEKIADDKPIELEVADYSAMEFPWERDMQNESDKEENDELSSMWKLMSLSFKCSQTASNHETDSTVDKDDTQDCIHDFILEDDLGKVCTLCGFIGQRIETIFDIQWPKAQKGTKYSRHAPNKDMETILGIDNAPASDCKRLEQKAPVVKLVLHPRIKKHMKPHQVDGFEFLQTNLITEEPGGCILAHAPGTGKTFLAISFIQSFLTKYPDERPLIVAPKSILCSWMTEFKKWQVEEIPVLNLYEVTNKAETLRCKQLQTLREWKEKKSILLVSYSQFSSIVCEKADNEMTASCQKILLEGPGLLVLDEGHFPRNKFTNIVNALSQIHTRRRILLSGTLYQNNIKELFNLLRLIRPDITELDSFQVILRRLIQSISGSEMHQKLIYRRHTQDPIERIFCEVLDYLLQSSSEEVKMSALHDLQELTALFVHYYRGDILEDLPGLVDFTVKLTINEKQRKALSKLQFVGNRMCRDIMSGAICMHPSLDGENISGWVESDGKNSGSAFATAFSGIRADPNDGVKTKFVLDVLSLCESTNEKLLVFSQYLPPLSLLENMIVAEKNWSKSREILRLDGSTPAEVRGSIIDQFNNQSDSKVLFASIKTCGEGICLTGASRVIILDIPWNPSICRQAISRAYRIGQKKKVFAYRLVAANTLEEEIHQASLKKELMSKMLFEESNQSEDSISLLTEVCQDDCEDMFFQSGSPLRENLHALYKHIMV